MQLAALGNALQLFPLGSCLEVLFSAYWVTLYLSSQCPVTPVIWALLLFPLHTLAEK